MSCTSSSTSLNHRSIGGNMGPERNATQDNKNATDSHSREYYAATGTRVSRVTVSRLHERGLFAGRPIVCVSLSSTNRKVHLKWYRDHTVRNTDKWKTILFIDESRFSLTSDSRRIFI
ncbi:transposable element Tc1 transposase [Trichonephila clavipes]|nr:transposable element Tc1 transposase [Trichonephila clavipes]